MSQAGDTVAPWAVESVSLCGQRRKKVGHDMDRPSVTVRPAGSWGRWRSLHCRLGRYGNARAMTAMTPKELLCQAATLYGWSCGIDKQDDEVEVEEYAVYNVEC